MRDSNASSVGIQGERTYQDHGDGAGRRSPRSSPRHLQKPRPRIVVDWDDILPDLAARDVPAKHRRAGDTACKTAASPASTGPQKTAPRDTLHAQEQATDITEIVTALGHLAEPSQLIALWIKNAQDGNKKAKTAHRTGYFTDPKALARAAIQQSGKAKGCYITVNPVDPESLDPQVLQRAFGCLSLYGPPKNENILRRLRLLIDIDPNRPKDTCATDAEKKLALAKACAVRDYLKRNGWPAPLMIDSGNGFYLIFCVELPTDDGNLIHNVIKAISERFSDEHVTIDTAVTPAKQVMRLPGTMNCKGTHTAERPHRPCKILEVPATATVVPQQLLEAVAAEVAPHATASTTEVAFDIEEVRASLDKMPPAVQGRNGSLAALKAARRIVVAYDVPWDSPEAWSLLQHYNARCQPPWNLQDADECQDLRRKLKEVDEYAAGRNQDRGYLRRRGTGRHYEPLPGSVFPVPIPDYGWMGYDTPAIVLDDPPVPYAYGLRLLRVWQTDRPDVLVPDVLVKLAHWGAKAPRDWYPQYRSALSEASRKGHSVHRIRPCAPDCMLHGTKIRHRHYKLGNTTCGCFDDFEDNDGEYVFEGARWTKYYTTGKVFHGYWPALIFGTSRRVGLTPQQVKLFMAITRELTRLAPRPTGKRNPHGKMTYARAPSDRPDRALVMHGNMVHDAGRDGGMIPCLALPPGDHVGFNGNLRKCRGSGYSLRTWAKRAGYTATQKDAGNLDAKCARAVLGDFAKLAEMFELTVVGRDQRTKRWYTLDEMRRLPDSRWGFLRLRQCTVRIYAPADHLVLWRYTFAKKLGFCWIFGGADCPSVLEDEILGTVNNLDELLGWLESHQVTRKEFAKRAGISRRQLCRALTERTLNTPKFWKKVNLAIERWDIPGAPEEAK